MRLIINIFLILGISYCVSYASDGQEETVYQTTDAYISTAIQKNAPSPKVIWVTKDLRPTIEKILKRKKFPLRYRYWRQENRTVWIMEEIGKVLPITTGITVEDGKIVDLSVLIYRESHGAEIRFPAYRNQFIDVQLNKQLRLSKPINGISGATLSTNAMKKLSRLALFLHSKVMDKDG